MRVLFATAELAPLVRVGGLAEAAGGLVAALRRAGVDVDVVLPDYGGVVLEGERRRSLRGPSWAGPMWVRSGEAPDVGDITLIGEASLEKDHPYGDADGVAWPDLDQQFMTFSAGVAALRDEIAPDVVHLNDWHTAAAAAIGTDHIPTVLTIHTLGYQGLVAPEWMRHFTRGRSDFEWYGQANLLLGGIRLADRVVAVSPNFAREMLSERLGMGLHAVFREKGDALVGIRNGIDAVEWNPADDPHIAAPYTADARDGKADARLALHSIAGWEQNKTPLIGVVSRLVDQKGIDLLLEAGPHLADLPARLFVLGSGLSDMAASLRGEAQRQPERMYFHDGYDLRLAHQVFAGSDLFAMPSRFEPCGLAQMQAMRYGSIPVVTPVGGLVDTVIDSDAAPARGNGFVAHTVDGAGVVDALHRAVRAWKHPQRRGAIQRRGMREDWSWDEPAKQHQDLYASLLSGS